MCYLLYVDTLGGWRPKMGWVVLLATLLRTAEVLSSCFIPWHPLYSAMASCLRLYSQVCNRNQHFLIIVLSGHCEEILLHARNGYGTACSDKVDIYSCVSATSFEVKKPFIDEDTSHRCNSNSTNSWMVRIKHSAKAESTLAQTLRALTIVSAVWQSSITWFRFLSPL